MFKQLLAQRTAPETSTGVALSGAMDIGEPDTEREVEVSPLEEPVPSTAPAEVPAVEPVPA